MWLVWFFIFGCAVYLKKKNNMVDALTIDCPEYPPGGYDESTITGCDAIQAIQ